MLKSKIESYLRKAIRKTLNSVDLTRTNTDPFPFPYKSAFSLYQSVFVPENEQFGHYSTNVALKLAKVLNKNPLQIAEEIKSQLEKQPDILGLIKETKVA